MDRPAHVPAGWARYACSNPLCKHFVWAPPLEGLVNKPVMAVCSKECSDVVNEAMQALGNGPGLYLDVSAMRIEPEGNAQ